MWISNLPMISVVSFFDLSVFLMMGIYEWNPQPDTKQLNEYKWIWTTDVCYFTRLLGQYDNVNTQHCSIENTSIRIYNHGKTFHIKDNYILYHCTHYYRTEVVKNVLMTNSIIICTDCVHNCLFDKISHSTLLRSESTNCIRHTISALFFFICFPVCDFRVHLLTSLMFEHYLFPLLLSLFNKTLNETILKSLFTKYLFRVITNNTSTIHSHFIEI